MMIHNYTFLFIFMQHLYSRIFLTAYETPIHFSRNRLMSSKKAAPSLFSIMMMRQIDVSKPSETSMHKRKNSESQKKNGPLLHQIVNGTVFPRYSIVKIPAFFLRLFRCERTGFAAFLSYAAFHFPHFRAFSASYSATNTPDLPPSFRTRRISVMRIPLSIALHMS